MTVTVSVRNGRKYTLVKGVDDVPRFTGDKIFTTERWEIHCDDVLIGMIYRSDSYAGRFLHSLTKLRWAGKQTTDFYDHNWHDSGPIDALLDCFSDAINRADYIYKWRAGYQHA